MASFSSNMLLSDIFIGFEGLHLAKLMKSDGNVEL